MPGVRRSPGVAGRRAGFHLCWLSQPNAACTCSVRSYALNKCGPIESVDGATFICRVVERSYLPVRRFRELSSTPYRLFAEAA